jgi:hypothetical protein
MNMNKLYTYSNYSSFYQRPIPVQYIVVYLIARIDTLLKSSAVWSYTGYTLVLPTEIIQIDHFARSLIHERTI